MRLSTLNEKSQRMIFVNSLILYQMLIYFDFRCSEQYKSNYHK